MEYYGGNKIRGDDKFQSIPVICKMSQSTSVAIGAQSLNVAVTTMSGCAEKPAAALSTETHERPDCRAMSLTKKKDK